MDDLVYICTKLARQMDADGLDRVFEAAQAATLAIEDGRPLLERAIQLADEVRWAWLHLAPTIRFSQGWRSHVLGSHTRQRHTVPSRHQAADAA